MTHSTSILFSLKRISVSFIFLFTILISNNSFAQKQTNFWHFGTLAGLDFTTASPVALTNSKINTTEGTATISDVNGNLLFYTDGVDVYDKTNTQMPNGFGLMGDVSTSQTIIVPDPGDSTKHYIFTLDDEAGPNGLNYSIVDMTLNGGNGDIAVKNVHLRNNMTEKIAAVHHCNNNDVWVLTHEMSTNAFIAYLVTNSGISTPVISNVGGKHFDLHGQVKFNNIGTKIACSISYQDTIQLFDFNKSTGVVSNPITIAGPLNYRGFGVEFSPDNSKLYGGFYDGGQSVAFQWDMNAANIPASVVSLNTNFNGIHRAFQLAPDGKIYISIANGMYLDAIDDPNLAGAACNYHANAVNIDPLFLGSMTLIGLPGFIASYFNPLFPNIPCFTADFVSSDTVICANSCVSFTDLSSGSPFQWQWDFPGANPPASSLQNPTPICYSTPGFYPVTLIVTDSSGVDTLTRTAYIHVVPPVVPGTLSALQDTLCQGTAGNLTLTGNSSNILQWQSSITTSNFADIPGAVNVTTYTTPPLIQTTYYRVVVGNGNCAAFSDTFRLYVPPALTALYGAVVSGKQVTFTDSSQGTIVSYSWDFGDGQTSTNQNPVHTYTKDTTYSVCLTIYDGSNCSYTLCKYIVIGISGTADISSQTQWVIYTDPVNNYIFIHSGGGNDKITGVEVYDVLGRTVISQSTAAPSDPLKINTSSLPKGVYYLKIKTKETDYVQRILKP